MYRHRLIEDGHMAENGYFGQIASQKGPGDPLVDHTKLKKSKEGQEESILTFKAG